MANIWFTSDLHFYHNRDFLFVPRGFETTEDMVEAEIIRWNEVVADEDTVYVLGDCILNDNERGIAALKRLKGHKHLIFGNHDTDARIKLYKENGIFETMQYALMIKSGKRAFYLSHYPTVTGNHDGTAPYNIHGHTHSKDKWCDIEGCYNVNQDAHNCYPVNIEQIKKELRERMVNTKIKEEKNA